MDRDIDDEIARLEKRIIELEEIEKLYNALFDRTNDAVFLINMDGTHRKVNQRALEMLGYTRQEMECKPAFEFVADQEYFDSLYVKKKLSEGERIPIYERTFKRKDGTFFYGENDVSLVKDDEGNPQFFFSIVRDISERKKYEFLLQELAGTDPLTGLYNRRKMIEEAKREKTRCDRSSKPFTFILLDIDLFKKINDSYGHEAGDYVLVKLSEIIKKTLREQDLCCRWGGEEFLILLPETDRSGGFLSAEKIRKAVLKYSFEYKKEKLKISITSGVAQYRKEKTIDSCINDADIALYKGKNSGRNQTIMA